MMTKKIIVPGVFLILSFLFAFGGFAQTDDIAKITEQIKVSYDLLKLNDCRIKLRAIEYSQLKKKEEKEQYAEAYKQLALAFRNHRYSRPAYEIYQKYLALKDTIMKEEKENLVSETLKKHTELSTSVLDDISAAESEKKSLNEDKTILDSLKKNNFRYSILFTVVLLGIFIFILIKYNNKLKSAKNSLRSNRKTIFEKNNEVIKGQMAFGIINRLKFLNESISVRVKNASSLYEATNHELKSFKDTEQPLKSLKENVSQIRQLSEISAKTIADVLKKISDT